MKSIIIHHDWVFLDACLDPSEMYLLLSLISILLFPYIWIIPIFLNKIHWLIFIIHHSPSILNHNFLHCYNLFLIAKTFFFYCESPSFEEVLFNSELFSQGSYIWINKRIINNVLWFVWILANNHIHLKTIFKPLNLNNLNIQKLNIWICFIFLFNLIRWAINSCRPIKVSKLLLQWIEMSW